MEAAEALESRQIDVVGVAPERGAAREIHRDRPRRGRRWEGADHVEDEGDNERADRNVGEHRMHRVAEPRPVQEIAKRRERAVDGAEDALHQIAERVGPGGLRVDDGLEPATQHCGAIL